VSSSSNHPESPASSTVVVCPVQQSRRAAPAWLSPPPRLHQWFPATTAVHIMQCSTWPQATPNLPVRPLMHPSLPNLSLSHLKALHLTSPHLTLRCTAFKISQGTSPESLGSIAPSTPATFLYCYAWKATGAIFAAVMSVSPYLPVLARHWFYALCLSLSLGSLWDFWCLMAVLCFNIEVAPSFDKPWLSSSFADYWARRWNLTTTYMLR
jgi:hypothetical protein